MRPIRVLILTNDRKAGSELAGILQGVGNFVRCASSVKAALAASLDSTFQVVVASPVLSDGTFDDVVRQMRSKNPVRTIGLCHAGEHEPSPAGFRFDHHIKLPPVEREVRNVLAQTALEMAGEEPSSSDDRSPDGAAPRDRAERSPLPSLVPGKPLP